MKALLAISFLIVGANTFAQQQARFGLKERLKIVALVVDVNDIDKEVFEALYSDYIAKQKQKTRCSYFMLNNLNRAASKIDEKEAFDCITMLFAARLENTQLREHYFDKIYHQITPTVAMQFLQAELLIDLMELDDVYNEAHLNNTVALASMTADLEQMKSAGLTEKNYDQSYEELLGESLYIFEHFLQRVSDLTPVQIWHRGHEFVRLLVNENLLTQKYFEQLVNFAGWRVAADRLARVDYEHTRKKMEVWANSELTAP